MQLYRITKSPYYTNYRFPQDAQPFLFDEWTPFTLRGRSTEKCEEGGSMTLLGDPCERLVFASGLYVRPYLPFVTLTHPFAGHELCTTFEIDFTIYIFGYVLGTYLPTGERFKIPSHMVGEAAMDSSHIEESRVAV